VEVGDAATVLELKQACEKSVSLAPEAQRLIFKGTFKTNLPSFFDNII
jgi:hypothetical protein